MKEIYNLTPINSTAAKVVSNGEHYQPHHKQNGEHWENKPITLPLPKNTCNRIGHRQGRLTVVGYMGKNKKRGAKWLVKCDCGHYETRYWKSLTNKNNTGDRCVDCRNIAFIKKQYDRSKTGADKNVLDDY